MIDFIRFRRGLFGVRRLHRNTMACSLFIMARWRSSGEGSGRCTPKTGFHQEGGAAAQSTSLSSTSSGHVPRRSSRPRGTKPRGVPHEVRRLCIGTNRQPTPLQHWATWATDDDNDGDGVRHDWRLAVIWSFFIVKRISPTHFCYVKREDNCSKNNPFCKFWVNFGKNNQP